MYLFNKWIINFLLVFICLTTSCNKDDDSKNTITEIVSFDDVELSNNGINPDPKNYFSDTKDNFLSYTMKFDFLMNKYDGQSDLIWSGFACSNQNNNTIYDYTNPYSVMDASNGNQPFLIYNMPSQSSNQDLILMEFKNKKEYLIEDMKICNSVYTYHTILEGNDFMEPFGMGDIFRIYIHGYDVEGKEKGKIKVTLADYSSSNKSEWTIIDRWTSINYLSDQNISKVLGKVNKLSISFESTMSNNYGITTPLYVCIDDIKYEKNISE